MGDDVRILGEVAGAERLELGLDNPRLEHGVTGLLIDLEHVRGPRANDITRVRRFPWVHFSVLSVTRAACAAFGSLTPGTITSPWPIPSVLIHRCWPNVSDTKYPSSTI